MEPAEKTELIKLAFNHISKNSTQKWVSSVLKDLKLAYSPISITYYLGGFNLINDIRFIH